MQTEVISIIKNFKVGNESPAQNFITKNFPWLALIILPFLKISNAIKATAIVSLFILTTFLQPLYASPQDGVVTDGSATISQSGTYTQITQTSDRAVINWQSFNIANGEHVHFQQPSAGSIALNRINPANGASQIYGRLSATGQVWLINPAGILFGPTAQIDVNGILATTANIHNADFMAGRHEFIQSPDWHGAIINEGNIRAADYGMVALVAPAVINRGIIQARLGKIALAAGNQFTVDFYGDHLINFGVNAKVTQFAQDANGNEVKAGITNEGSVIADGGKILMTARVAKDIVDNVINMKGVAQAKAVMQKGGEIVLLGGDEGIVSVTGKIDVSGKGENQKGGNVKVTGEWVGLFDGARIDASGSSGGGDVLIGGDYQGKNPDVFNASRTLVMPDVVIDASALVNGNAGKVVNWADGDTQFYGTILARGGAQGGNGGFVEISGKQEGLTMFGQVDTRAPNGQIGTLLLDPKDIHIVLGGSGSLAGQTFGFDQTGSQLIGADLFSSATSDIILQANNDISIETSISMGNDVDLTLQAGRSIILGSGVNVTTTNGNITLTANETAANGVISAQRDSGAGAITMDSTASIVSTSGNITLLLNTGAGLTNSTSDNITVSTINAGTGAIVISNLGTTANSSIVGASGTNLLTGSSVVLHVAGAASGTGSIGTNATPIRVTTDRLAVRILNQTGGVYLNSPTKGVILGGISALNGIGIYNITGQTNLVTNGDITDESPSTVSSLSISPGSNANSITLDAVGNAIAGLAVTQGNNLTVMNNTGSFNFGNTTITGDLLISTTGVITQSGSTALNIGGDASFSSGSSNSIGLGNDNSFGGVVSIASASSATIKDTTALVLGNINIASLGNLNLEGVGISQDANTSIIASTGITTLTAGSGNDITLNNNTSNDFSNVRIISGNNVDLRVTSSLNFGGAGTSTIGGNLTVNTVGNITQGQAIQMSNLAALASFTSSTGSITLRNGSNSFNNFSASAAGGIGLTNNRSLIVAGNGITSGGDLVLDVRNNGTLTQTAAIIMNNNASADLGSVVASTINLNNSLNDFNTVTITNGTGSATVYDIDDIKLGSTTAVGLNIVAGGDITQASNSYLNIGTNNSSFSAGNGSADITINNANSITNIGVVTFNGRNVSVYDPDFGITIGASTITGNLTVQTTNDAINNSGAVNVAGNTTFIAGSGVIDFDNAVNNLVGTVSITSASSATISNGTNLVLGAASIAGAYNVSSTGSISDTGTTTISASTLTANAANGITLNNGHDIDTVNLTNTSSGDITYYNNSASLLEVGTVSQGSTGATTVQNLGDIITTGGMTIASGGNFSIISTNGLASIGSAISTTGETTINVRGNDIGINATIDNPNGTVNLIANADLLVNASGTGAQISTLELQRITTQNLGLLGTNITTGIINLAADTTLTSSNAININGAINNNYALTLTGDGAINIAAAIGDTTPIKSLTVNGNGTANLGANITAQGNTITFDTPVILTNNVALTDSGTTGITFNDTVNGNFDLVLTAANGDINFNALVGNSQRLGAVTIDDAVDFSSNALFNASSFTQTQGSGTTSFLAGLNTTNDISVNTNDISGSYTGNAITLTAVDNYTANVIANSLILDGQDGANITGTIAGIGGVAAALETDLAVGATGLYYVNGCLVGTSCTGSGGSGSPTVTPNDQTLLPDSGTLDDESDVNTQDDTCNYIDPVTQEKKNASGANCVNIKIKKAPEKSKVVQKSIAKFPGYKASNNVIVIPKTLAADLVFAK